MPTFEIISTLLCLTYIGRFSVHTSRMYMMYPSLHATQSARFSEHVNIDIMQAIHHYPTDRLVFRGDLITRITAQSPSTSYLVVL